MGDNFDPDAYLAAKAPAQEDTGSIPMLISRQKLIPLQDYQNLKMLIILLREPKYRQNNV